MPKSFFVLIHLLLVAQFAGAISLDQEENNVPSLEQKIAEKKEVFPFLNKELDELHKAELAEKLRSEYQLSEEQITDFLEKRQQSFDVLKHVLFEKGLNAFGPSIEEIMYDNAPVIVDSPSQGVFLRLQIGALGDLNEKIARPIGVPKGVGIYHGLGLNIQREAPRENGIIPNYRIKLFHDKELLKKTTTAAFHIDLGINYGIVKQRDSAPVKSEAMEAAHISFLTFRKNSNSFEAGGVLGWSFPIPFLANLAVFETDITRSKLFELSMGKSSILMEFGYQTIVLGAKVIKIPIMFTYDKVLRPGGRNLKAMYLKCSRAVKRSNYLRKL